MAGRNQDRKCIREELSAVQAGRLMARACDILSIATVITMYAFEGQFEHAIGQGRQKMPVMRNEEHGALILCQRLDQHFLGRHVEMVGRFVEHEKIRRIEQHDRHHQPRLLAAG